jgi:hypothetical protein
VVREVLTHAAAASTAVLAGVFLFAGALKLRDFRVFAERLRDFDLVPPAFVTAAAAAIVVWEIVVGFAVVVTPRVGGLLAGATLVLFGVVVAVSWLRGKRDIPCACFGQAREARLGWHVVVRDVGLAFLALPTFSFAAGVSLGEVGAGAVAVLMYVLVLAVVTEALRTAETLRAQRDVLALPIAEEP